MGLKEFDPAQVDPKMLARLQKYTMVCSPDVVSRVSKAVVGLCLWIHALVVYREATIHLWSPPPDAPQSAVTDEIRPDEIRPAKQILSSLKELHALKKPPEHAFCAVDAAMILLGEDPPPETASLTTTRIFSIPSFLQRLADFDPTAPEAKERIAATETFLAACLGTTSPEAQLALLKIKTCASGGLLSWVHSVIKGEPMELDVPLHYIRPPTQ